MFTYPYPWSVMSSATSVTVSVDVQILEALGLEPTQEQALCLEPTRERALGSIMGSKTSHHKRWVFPEAPVWRTAGLKEPRTAGLREPLTVVGMTSEPLTAGLSEPRMAAGLSEPRMAMGLTSPWTAGLSEPRMATGLTFRATDIWLGFPVDGGLERAAAGGLVLDRGRTLSRHRRIPSLQLSPVVSGIRGLHGTRTGSKMVGWVRVGSQSITSCPK